MSQHIVCGIDVGNTAVKTVISSVNREVSRPRVIGVGIAPSHGLRRGMVVDMEEITRSIGNSVNQAQRMAGVTVDHAYVGISGLHIKTQLSRGVVAVSRADSEISQTDVDRVIEAASTVSLPPNYEIIHIITKRYVIDGQEIVKNPVGMKGIRLEAEVLLVEGLSPYIHNLTKCVSANDIDIAELIFAPLAASKSVLDKHQREYGVLLVDFGGGVTSMALFHEGELLHIAVLPIGARHITNDLAIAFRTSLDNAEIIKRKHGDVSEQSASQSRESVDISDLVGENDFVVPKKQIAKIVNARMGELCDLITDELKRTPGTQVLPAGLVLAGGGANLTGVETFAKTRLGLATRVGGNYLMEGLSETVMDPAFAVCVGLVLWGDEQERINQGTLGTQTRALKKIGGWLKNFLP